MVELPLRNLKIVLKLSDGVPLQSLNFQILCQFRARFLDIQTVTECRLTLKCVCTMIKIPLRTCYFKIQDFSEY